MIVTFMPWNKQFLAYFLHLLWELQGGRVFYVLLSIITHGIVCVYFYYGANKSGSRAMWGLRQSDAISGFFYGKQCAQYPEFSWLKKIHHNMFVCFIVYIEKYIILYSKWQFKGKKPAVCKNIWVYFSQFFLHLFVYKA